MPKAVITPDEHSAMDAVLQAEYTQATDGDNSGNFVLNVEEAGGLVLENVGGLRSSLEAARGERDAAQKALKAIPESIRNDPSSATKALKAYEKLKDRDLDAEAEAAFEAQKGELVAAHKTELEAEQAKTARLSAALEKNLIVAAASEAISSEGGSLALLMPHVSRQVRMKPPTSEDGDYIAEVFNPETGSPRVGDASGNPMTIPQLIAEMKGKDEFAPAFNGTGSTGSGAGGNNQGGAGSGGKKTTTTSGTGAVKKIPRSDQAAINSHWQEIAAGTAEVVDG